MDSKLIFERGIYAQSSDAGYFRQVELIVLASERPGGQVVQWSTDAFGVLAGQGRQHGKCGIETFARWAKVRLR